MKKGDKVFVYGSLRKGESADLSMRSGSRFLCFDRINGLLYGVSWFPGFKALDLPGNDFNPNLATVSGEVYEVTDDALCRQLDSYEGYPNLYTRIQIETERSHLVWVYVYNGEVGDNQLVVTGDWLNREERAAA